MSSFDTGTEIVFDYEDCRYTALHKDTKRLGYLAWREDGSKLKAKPNREVTLLYIQSLKSHRPKELYDKEVYFDKGWKPATLLCQEGEYITVLNPDHGEINVPFQQVRDWRAACSGCERRLNRNSYQDNRGQSFCWRCFEKFDSHELELYFNGPQWFAWDGQISIREMEQGHLVNTLAILKKNANTAADEAGGKPQEYLHPAFEHMVSELHRRRPIEEKIKVNNFLLQIYMVMIMLLGWRSNREE